MLLWGSYCLSGVGVQFKITRKSGHPVLQTQQKIGHPSQGCSTGYDNTRSTYIQNRLIILTNTTFTK
jgi:hypothetical protein